MSPPAPVKQGRAKKIHAVVSSSTTPSADHDHAVKVLLPLVHNHAAASRLTSHEACLAIGGYSLPSLSTLGSHVHLSSAGTRSITAGTWLPHPHQVAFSKKHKVSKQSVAHGRKGGKKKKKKKKRVHLLHVSQVAFRHMVVLLIYYQLLRWKVIWEREKRTEYQ